MSQAKTPSLAAALALPSLAFLVLLLLAPLLRLLGEGASWSIASGATPWVDMLGSGYLQRRLLWSLSQAAISCAMVWALGLPIAWVLARFEFAGRRAVLSLLMLPMVVPTLVAAMGVLALLGPSGLAMQWWGLDAQDSPYLLIYGNVFFNLPLVIRAALDGFARISGTQLAAARSLGATPWRAFWRVEWPLVRPWIASSLCLVFLYSFSSLGLALVLGGQRWGTLEVEIYTLVAHELKLPEASVLALISFVLSSAAAIAYTWREQHLATPVRADALPARSAQGGLERLGLGLGLLLLMLCCAAPIVALLWRVLQGAGAAWGVWLDVEVWQAVTNTLRFSAAALVLATALGLTHALAAQRWAWLRSLVYLPLVASAVTVAFGLLLLYPRSSATQGVLIGAYALLAFPFVAKAVGAALDAMPAHLLHAARSLGATPWRAFWRVTLPFIAPSLRRGMAFAAASCLGEFAVSLFLSRPEWATLTTLIYQRLGRPGRGNADEALVLAVLLLALAWACFALLEPRKNKEASHA